MRGEAQEDGRMRGWEDERMVRDKNGDGHTYSDEETHK